MLHFRIVVKSSLMFITGKVAWDPTFYGNFASRGFTLTIHRSPPIFWKPMLKNIRQIKFTDYAAWLLFFITLCATVGQSNAADGRSEVAELPSSQTTQLTQPEFERTLWTIDTRTAAYRRGTPLAEAGVRVLKKVDGCWQDSSRSELVAVDKKIPLVVFFHGMWLDRAGGREEGMRLYQILKQGDPNRPFQFVIWSWPAQRQQCAPRRDVRVKVSRTETQAFYVAQWIETLPKDRQICMVGYSLGSRIVSGSLELLAGGTICGQTLSSLVVECPEDEVRVLKGPHEVGEGIEVPPRRPLRAALVAAAIDNGSFLPGHRNGLVLTQVERLLVTRNSHDKALRWYSALYRIGGPKAMGFTGPACSSRLGEEGDRLDVLSVSCVVGRGHYWMNYLRSGALRRELLDLALEPCVDAAPVE